MATEIIEINDSSSVHKLIEKFENDGVKSVSTNLILDFSKKINTKIEEIVLFLNVRRSFREHGMSFVIVFDGVNLDSLPEDLVVVPTIQEANDIIEMEEIERDLGF